jgi:integrase
VEELDRWRERQLFERLEWGDAWRDTGSVFNREDGSPVNPNWWSRSFERAARQAGLPGIPPKNLRHTHASLALEAGIDLRVVAGRLGHALVSITGDVHAQFIDRMDQRAADRVAALVFGS